MKRINLIVLSALIVANVVNVNASQKKLTKAELIAMQNELAGNTPKSAAKKQASASVNKKPQLTRAQLIAIQNKLAANIAPAQAKSTGYSTATIVGGLATAGLVAYEALAYYMGYPSAVCFTAGKAKDLYDGMTIENAKAAYAAVTWANAKNLFTNIVTLGGMLSFGDATAKKLAELPTDNTVIKPVNTEVINPVSTEVINPGTPEAPLADAQ